MRQFTVSPILLAEKPPDSISRLEQSDSIASSCILL